MVWAEGERISSESEKISAEKERVSAGSEKVSADSERISAKSESLSPYSSHHGVFTLYKYAITCEWDGFILRVRMYGRRMIFSCAVLTSLL